jgi:anti-sigma-K factor RskA
MSMLQVILPQHGAAQCAVLVRCSSRLNKRAVGSASAAGSMWGSTPTWTSASSSCACASGASYASSSTADAKEKRVSRLLAAEQQR